jgi:hypothetical protein
MRTFIESDTNTGIYAEENEFFKEIISDAAETVTVDQCRIDKIAAWEYDDNGDARFTHTPKTFQRRA